MQRLVQVTVPERHGEMTVCELTSLEWISCVDVTEATRVVVHTEEGEEMRKTSSVRVRKCAFKVRDIYLSATLKALRGIGIGESFGAIDVLDVRTTTERALRAPKRRRGCCPSLQDRLSTLEIHGTIEGASHMSADHCCCAILASLIASIGLLSDQSSIVLAALCPALRQVKLPAGVLASLPESERVRPYEYFRFSATSGGLW